MFSIAILVSDDMLPDADDAKSQPDELEEQMGKIRPCFAALDMKADLVRWRDAAQKAPHYDAVLPLFVWDYFEGHEKAFLSEMAKVETQTKLYNTFDCLKWNANKSYLEELEKLGAPVIRTLTVERVTQRAVEAAFDTLKTDTLVIKPQVGGGAWRQVLHKKGDPFPQKNELPPQEAMIQAFLPSVKEEGEYSFLYFGGQFSHAVNKRPQPGEYRIQSTYGGIETPYSPSSQERDTARSILNVLDFTPLYARVDLLRGTDGQLKLIELEMIEPYLYMTFAEGEGGDNQGAKKLALALKKRLDKTASL